MPQFRSDGINIHFIDEGEGEPVVLIHGFASNIETNWVNTGWTRTLNKAGFRTIALDNRGHGNSEKLYVPDVYGSPSMAGDVVNLLDHLELPSAFIIGYSMGARISAFLSIRNPDRVKKAVFAGLGYNMVRGVGGAGPIARALEAPTIEDVANDTARTFRAFAESTGSDLKALAMCIRASREKITPEQVGTITRPVLVVVGSKDVIGGSAKELADLIPGSRHLELANRDHMTAVGDLEFKQAAIDFFSEP